jgi:glycerophosphoryl diester phosphodiesterase
MLPQPAIVAHRGASTEAPENTLAAFNRACELGVNAIESDVRATRDGELVLCHDESLLRLTGQAEKIADLDLATLREVVVGVDRVRGEQRIVTPDELLRFAAGRVGVLLDLKLPTGYEGRVLDAIRAAGVERGVIVGVRSVASLRACKETTPQLTTLAFGRTIDEVWAMADAGADILRLWAPWVDGDAIARAGQAGTPVWVMCGAPGRGEVGETTVPELLDYRRAGIAGVILNDPRPALAANAADEPAEG